MIECVNFRKDVYISLNLKRTSDIFISCSRPELLTDNQGILGNQKAFSHNILLIQTTEKGRVENLTFDIKT